MSIHRLYKRHIILLELVIAMSLAMVILSTLTFFYYQVNMINAKMDREQNENFQKLYVENRLAAVLPRALSSKDSSRDFHFFTSSDPGGLFKEGTMSLVFSFDNCVQLDKKMAYHVIGRLYLDQEGNLVLAKWPSEKRWKENEPPPLSKEVLLQEVEDLSFSFFIPPQKVKAPHSRIPEDLKGRWESRWEKEYHQLPSIVKVILTKKNSEGEEEQITYAFPLPHTINPVIYTE